MTDYEAKWLNAVEEINWLTKQNERLKGNKRENPTLRDQFAMAALTGLLANNVSTEKIHDYAYTIADAMMQQRDK